MVETLIVLPLAAFLLFSIFEIAIAYRAKSTLDRAAFEVSRSGALDHARLSSMNDQLARSLIPLFVDGDAGVFSMGKAWTESKLLVASGAAKIDIISPTKIIFDTFKKRMFLPEEGKNVWAIPNDNLTWRRATKRRIGDGDDRIDINIQDANLLKVEVKFCHALVVPIIDRIIVATLTHLMTWGIIERDAQFATCNLALSAITGHRYIVLSSDSVFRMQTAVYGEDLP